MMWWWERCVGMTLDFWDSILWNPRPSVVRGHDWDMVVDGAEQLAEKEAEEDVAEPGVTWMPSWAIFTADHPDTSAVVPAEPADSGEGVSASSPAPPSPRSTSELLSLTECIASAISGYAESQLIPISCDLGDLNITVEHMRFLCTQRDCWQQLAREATSIAEYVMSGWTS